MQAIIPNSAPTEPKRVCHWYNLAWWVVLIGVVAATQMLYHHFVIKTPPPVSVAATAQRNTSENEAFIALAFGKVSATHELAISATSFAGQLASLKQAGYSTVRLAQINQWRKPDAMPLPAKPVLLTFEEANRETMQIADKLLAKLGMTALVFVDVDQLNKGNIHLVSWHQLELLANNGRWEVGISACPYNDDGQAFTSADLLGQKLRQQREQLESRLEVPVIVADCSRRWEPGQRNGEALWKQALGKAYLPIGFLAAPFGANYKVDSEASFKRIRVSKDWDNDGLLAQLQAHAPRRAAFVDKFQAGQAVDEWVVDSGDIALEGGSLQLFNKPGEQGGLIMLGGTEKWQDADVEVRLKGQPQGQFWISQRYRIGKPFVRLGLSEGRVVLQKSDGAGTLNQLAGVDMPSGDIALRLHLVGSRAIAYLNGRPLLDRPVEMPEGADHGPLALAVWTENDGDGFVGSEKALVNLAQVKATPLFPKGGIIGPITGVAAWQQLNQQVEELAMISPRYFSWKDGKAHTATADKITLEIFARYHHLQLLPALSIDGNTPLSDRAALAGQALIWASDPAYDGLNIILPSAMADAQWRPFLDDLGQRMNRAGKVLVMTLLDSNGQTMLMNGNEGLLLVTTPAELLPANPMLLYPANIALALVP